MNANGSILRKADATGVPLLIARLILGGLFLYMGFNKLGHPVEFLKQIRLYGLLPESPPYFLNGTAIVLPWLEIICGALIVLGVFLRGAALQALLMLSVFTPAILYRALQIRAESGTPFLDIEFDCGCGAGVVITWKKLLENSSLWLLSLYTLLSGSRRFSLRLLIERRKPDPSYCHFCGYRVKNAKAGLCEECASPPALRPATAEPA